jgi:hypothetical protein
MRSRARVPASARGRSGAGSAAPEEPALGQSRRP